MNKKSRSNNGSKRRPPYDDGGSPQQAQRRSGTTNYYDDNRRASQNRMGNTGSASHFQGLYDKNMNLARESFNDGDRVSAEYYFQNADHYLRMMTGRRRHPVEFVSPAETQETSGPIEASSDTTREQAQSDQEDNS